MVTIFPFHSCNKCGGDLKSTGEESENGYELGECLNCGHRQEVK